MMPEMLGRIVDAWGQDLGARDGTFKATRGVLRSILRDLDRAAEPAERVEEREVDGMQVVGSLAAWEE